MSKSDNFKPSTKLEKHDKNADHKFTESFIKNNFLELKLDYENEKQNTLSKYLELYNERESIEYTINSLIIYKGIEKNESYKYKKTESYLQDENIIKTLKKLGKKIKENLLSELDERLKDEKNETVNKMISDLISGFDNQFVKLLKEVIKVSSKDYKLINKQTDSIFFLFNSCFVKEKQDMASIESVIGFIDEHKDEIISPLIKPKAEKKEKSTKKPKTKSDSITKDPEKISQMLDLEGLKKNDDIEVKVSLDDGLSDDDDGLMDEGSDYNEDDSSSTESGIEDY